MPLLIAAIGIVFFVAALRGQTSTLFALVHNDFTGKENFLVWAGAILGLGLFGYIKQVRPVAGGFLVLIVLALVLSNKGFFANFATAFEATQSSPQETVSASASTPATGATQTGVPASLQTGFNQAVTAITGEADSFNNGVAASLPSIPSVPLANAGELVNDLF